MYWFWLVMEYPYGSKYEHIDLFLAAGKSHERYLHGLGVDDSRIAMVGLSRYTHFDKFTREHSSAESRQILGIGYEADLYILYDPNLIMRGFLSPSEQIDTLELLLNLARQNHRVAVLIKPHPGHHPGMLETVIKSYDLPNVFLLAKNMAPYHALNMCDLLITKYSTIGLESMFFKHPVIAVILDGEPRWKLFGEAAEYVLSLAELESLLARIIKDQEFFAAWRGQQLQKQEKYLAEYFDEKPVSSAALAAKAIDRHIKKSLESRALNTNAQRP
jgi:CDP-glycerol glycerophosphotransferase (TagB/SpsB family)